MEAQLAAGHTQWRSSDGWFMHESLPSISVYSRVQHKTESGVDPFQTKEMAQSFNKWCHMKLMSVWESGDLYTKMLLLRYTGAVCERGTQVPSVRQQEVHPWLSKSILKPFESSSSTAFGLIKTQVFTMQFSWFSSRSGALRHNVITVGLPVPQQWFSTGGTGSKSGSVFKDCVCVPGNTICV